MKELPKVEDKDFQYTVSADIPWMKDLLKLDERLKTKYELSLEPVFTPEDPHVKQMDDLALEVASALQLYEARGVALPTIQYLYTFSKYSVKPTATKFGHLVLLDSETPVHIRRDGAWCILKKRYATEREKYNGYDNRTENIILSSLLSVLVTIVCLMVAAGVAKLNGYNEIPVSPWWLLVVFLICNIAISNYQFFTISIPKFLSRNIWRFGKHETKTATYEYAKNMKSIRNQIFNA